MNENRYQNGWTIKIACWIQLRIDRNNFNFDMLKCSWDKPSLDISKSVEKYFFLKYAVHINKYKISILEMLSSFEMLLLSKNNH